MKVEACARAMAADGKTIAFITPPPRGVSEPKNIRLGQHTRAITI